ncbi:hypothetical protein [Micromonospora sp. CPCC 206061]|uniref:hypothetical protein n=1 Tax=Micromonospora sp. CPCC 206061 TaxID=3122410 RepID=UPI002FF35F05
MTLRIVSHSENLADAELRRTDAGIELSVRFNASPGGSVGSIRVEIEATDLMMPMPERTPVNRAACGLRIRWYERFRHRTRLMIHRSAGGITCFTKGNYAMSFPSRPATDGMKTLILYADPRTVELLYGFVRDPSTALLRSASSLVFAGLGFLAAWLMAQAVVAGTEPEVAQYLAMLGGLAIPTVTAFGEIVAHDRHSLYARRRDLGFTVTLIAITAGVAGIAGAAYLSLASDFGSSDVPEHLSPLPRCFAVTGVLLLAGGVVLLTAYRSGLLIPYVCDNAACINRLYLRYRRRDCYATGRILCGSCESTVCMPCPRNFWQRGLAVIDDVGRDPVERWQYRCLDGGDRAQTGAPR